jgi:putative hemolysin
VDIDLPADLLHAEILKMNHSKILACRKYQEEFVGVLIVKEYLLNYFSDEPAEITQILHSPIIIPESTVAQKVLNLFKQKQFYYSVVVNEYGSLEGIITLHDILESIVGDFPEENEIAEPDIFVRDDQSVLVSGDAPVEILVDLIEDFKIDFEEVEYATVAGFVFSIINKIPELGDKFVFSDSIIEVVDIDHNKIDKVLITKKK